MAMAYQIPTDDTTISPSAGYMTQPIGFVSLSQAVLVPAYATLNPNYSTTIGSGGSGLGTGNTIFGSLDPTINYEGSFGSFVYGDGGLGDDPFTGTGIDGGNYIGAGAGTNLQDLYNDEAGANPFTGAGIDFNAGNISAAMQDELNLWEGAGTAAPNLNFASTGAATAGVGNAGQGFIDLANSAGVSCFASAGAAGLASATTAAASAQSKGGVGVAYGGIAAAVMGGIAGFLQFEQCEASINFSPNADERAALDAMGTARSYSLFGAAAIVAKQYGFNPLTSSGASSHGVGSIAILASLSDPTQGGKYNYVTGNYTHS